MKRFISWLKCQDWALIKAELSVLWYLLPVVFALWILSVYTNVCYCKNHKKTKINNPEPVLDVKTYQGTILVKDSSSGEWKLLQ